MFRIVTLEREYGCGCAGIATALADRLGWKLWDHQLTEEIAKQAHVDCGTVEQREEKIDGTFYRLAKSFWRGSYERSMPMAEAQTFDADCMVAMMERITARIAEDGNAVVVGRGAPYFLRERADTFRVFLYAPQAEKIRVVLDNLNIHSPTSLYTAFAPAEALRIRSRGRGHSGGLSERRSQDRRRSCSPGVD